MATETRTRTQTEEPTSATSAHPPPPSPPTSPPVQPTSARTQHQQQPPPPVGGMLYYGKLFKKDKTPTPLLEALLRAIGKHIENEIGDRNENILNKSKLAAFYKAVGGDYDSLFVNAPDKSISYIWQALGVQHTLQPTADDFAEPAIPALTLRGFVRWESLQILLGPEEHVPFMQFAVRNWALKHPDTGLPFPLDLPSDSFPQTCDPQIDQWHKDCAKRLRTEAAPAVEKSTPSASPDPRVHFNHVPGHGTVPSRRGPAMDYFERPRPVPFNHIPGRSGAYHSQSPNKHKIDSSSSSSLEEERAWRRRSFSDYALPKHEKVRPASYVDPRRPTPVRRHSSQPRHAESESADSESDAAPAGPRTRVHRPVRPPVASVRVYPPESPVSPPMPQGPARVSHRTEDRRNDPRRQSLPSGHLGIRQKVMSFLPGSHDRQRSNSRSDRENDSRPSSSRLRPEHTASRPARRYSDEADSSEETGSDVSPKHHSHRERQRDREYEREREREREKEKEKIREREQREREIEEERERRSRKDRAYLRPSINRRTSSAADVERKTREWDVRDRYRDRERERERQRSSRSSRNFDRERERAGSPVVGVSGRKYPAESLKPGWS